MLDVVVVWYSAAAAIFFFFLSVSLQRGKKGVDDPSNERVRENEEKRLEQKQENA